MNSVIFADFHIVRPVRATNIDISQCQDGNYYDLDIENAPPWLGRVDTDPLYIGTCHIDQHNEFMRILAFRRIFCSDGKYMEYNKWETMRYARPHLIRTPFRFLASKQGRARFVFVGHTFLKGVPEGELEDPHSRFWFDWEAAITSVFGEQIRITTFDSWKNYAEHISLTTPNKYIKILKLICEGAYCRNTNRMTVRKLDWLRRSHGDSRIILKELLDLGIAVVASINDTDYILPNRTTDLLTAIQVLSWFKE